MRRSPSSVIFLALCLALVIQDEGVNGFTISLAPPSRRKNSITAGQKYRPLHGILDDYEDELATTAADDDRGDDDDDNQQLEAAASYGRLLDDLVFGTNAPVLIADKLEECTEAGFQQFLQDSQTNAEDPEEAQAYQDLAIMIQDVGEDLHAKQLAAQAALQERLQQIEQEAAAAATDGSKTTKEDVMKKAAAVDQAIMTASAEAAEDEQPDNFMRDAKAVRGLSGFNNRGNMRVGGG